MPIISGGGGGGTFNGGTITNALVVNKALAPNTSDRPLDVLDPNNADSEINLLRSVDGAGNENVSLSLSPALDGTAIIGLSDDNFTGSASLSSVGTLTLVPRAAVSVGDVLISAGAAGSTAGVRVGGLLHLRGHAAPADAALLAGDLVLWFDQTNGAAKLMVKAKTADGTVVTASVALA